MTSPYVYTPAPSYPSYHASNYLDHSFFATPTHSPFIPNAVLSGGAVYPPSPYATALTTPLPASPHYGPTPLPGDVTADWTGYPETGSWTYTRQRRPSWHGATAPTSPYSPGFLTPGAAQYFGHNRRHSFGASAAAAGYAPPWTSWAALSPSNQQIPVSTLPFQIHPWLNGEMPRNDFRLDLSVPNFAPQRLAHAASGTFVLLSNEELAQPATHPSITRLRIICDLIPQWPMDLSPLATFTHSAALPPLLFQDVLIMIHRTLHTRISHQDWARLNPTEENAITRAFSRRCASFGSLELQARNDGVKRVDFLRGKVWFRGLVPTAEKNTMKMILS